MVLFSLLMLGYRLSLWSAKRLGRIIYRLQRGWFPPVFWFLVTTFLIWLIDVVRHRINPQLAKTDIWFQFWTILAVYVILWMLWWAWQARKRVVIDTFMDYRGKDPISDSQGLATLLVVKLAQLHELYRVVDEQRAVSTVATANQPIDATIKVDDVSDFLMGAVSTQSKLNLGPLEIPIGTLLGLIGRFVQGPRIIGSLHTDDDNFIMTAQRVGSTPACSWRVDCLMPEGTKRSMDEMIGELACRIFTDLSLSGTVRWKAAMAFSEGLRHYRDCLRSSRDRLLKLRQAERKFIEALEEDRDFALAHYNLGVVYMELGQVEGERETGQLEAAEAAFLEAISHNPGSWNPYYALAICRYQRKQYDSAYRICLRISERGITQKPGVLNCAKISHMKGLAQMGKAGLLNQEQHVSSTHEPGPPSNADALKPALTHYKSAMKYYKRAIRQSWFALYKAQSQQLGVTETESLLIPQLEETLGSCMQDLATAYTHFAISWNRKRNKLRFQIAHELLHQATFLCSTSTENYKALFDAYSDNYIHIADLYCSRKKYTRAIKEYRGALRIDPENAGFWAHFAFAYACLFEQQKERSPEKAQKSKMHALEACDNAKRNAFELSDETEAFMDTLVITYNKLMEQNLHPQTKEAKDFLQKVANYQKAGNWSLHEVNNLVAEIGRIAYDAQTKGWLYAQVSLVIGRMYLQFNEPAEVERYLRGAISCLEQTYPHVIRERELRVILVYALLQQGTNETVLKNVADNADMREQECLQERNHFEEALKEAERALIFDPLCYFEREVLGDVYFKLNAFENAINAWEEALLRKNTFVPKLKMNDLPKIEMPILDFKLGTTYLFKQDNVDINFKIGISYIELGRHYHELEKKRDAYARALTYLQRAEAFYESSYEHQQQKQALYYFLGVLYFEQNDYQHAISYLRISKTLRFARLTSLFYLGYAYLKNKEYDSCIKQFRMLQTEALQLEQAGTLLNAIVESETVGFMSLGELLAMTYWGIAFAYAERNANLEVAEGLIKSGKEYLSQLPQEAKIYWPAHCLDCEGWIFLKQGKIDRAIKTLKSAITLSDIPQTYAHLALAYEGKLQETKDEAILQELRYCYHSVQELDIKKEYEQALKPIEQRLQTSL